MPRESAQAAEWDRVLIRHVMPARRDELDRLESLIHVPFETSSMSASGGSILDRPRGRWMIAAQFTDQNWAALFTNAGTSQELFERNAENARMEVAWVGHRAAEGGWFLRIARKGKSIVAFSQLDGGESKPKLKAAELPGDFLVGSASGAESFKRLCEHFGIAPRQRNIEAAGNAFQIIGLRGKPVTTGLRSYLLYHGPQIAAKENRAADRLGKAIDRCDADGIRKAVKAGASLEHLPDSSVSPLTTALYRYPQKGWKECAELLIELGSPVDGWPGDDPPVVDATHSFIGERHSLAMLKLLVEHGSDVNARDTSGGLALFNAVVEQRKSAIRLLLEHGADPQAKTSGGETIVEWLKSRIEDDQRHGGFSKYAKILTLLTGEEVEHPGLLALTDELKRENRRLDEAVQMVRVLKRARPSDKQAREELRDQVIKRLEKSPIQINGRPARFERLLCYPDIVSKDDPTWSTATVTENALEDLAEAEAAELKDSWRLEQGVTGAADLLVMRHVEFAGAPSGDDFISRGASIAVRYFESESRRSKPYADYWCVDELLQGFLLNILSDRWDDVEKISKTLKPSLATSKARMSDDPPRELAKFLLILASHFRDKAIRETNAMIADIRKSRHQHPKLLLETWEAVTAGDQAAFETTLTESLQHIWEQHPVATSFYELRRFLAWPESILLLIAEREGLSRPQLPEHLSDRLLVTMEH